MVVLLQEDEWLPIYKLFRYLTEIISNMFWIWCAVGIWELFFCHYHRAGVTLILYNFIIVSVLILLYNVLWIVPHKYMETFRFCNRTEWLYFKHAMISMSISSFLLLCVHFIAAFDALNSFHTVHDYWWPLSSTFKLV